MDSQSAPVVSAAKLPILNPNEFDHWKIRIKQYFLMTDYSQGKNKANLEEHGLDDLFNSLKIYETKVRHSSSPSNPTQNLAFVSSSNTDSTTDSVSAATSVSAICTKLLVSSHLNIDSLISAATSVSAVCTKLLVSSYLNIDSLSNAIDVDDLEEMDLRWQMAMLTMRARSFLQKTGRNLGDNRVTTMGFDMSKVECYNCHRKGHFARECRSPKDTRRTGGAEPHRRATPVNTSTSNALVSQCDACSKAYKQLYSQYDSQTIEFRKSRLDVLSYQAALESVESRLVVYKQNESYFQENIIVLKNKVEARHNFILTLKQKLKQAETERDDLKLKFEKLPSLSKSLTKLIASQTNNKHGLGYLSSEDDYESVSLTCPSDRLSPSGGYHAVSPANHAQAMSHITESMAPIIEDWVFDSEDESKPNDLQNTKPTLRNSTHKGCNKQYAPFTKKNPQKHKVPAAVLPKSKLVYVTAVRQISATVPKIMKSRPRPAHPLNRKSNPSIRRYKTHNQFSKTSNSSSKVTAAKVSVVGAIKGKKGNGYEDQNVPF
nr:hypothetical protein [Tanacetum cinerariifolium]